MKNKVLAAPYIVWMALFIIVPLGIVVYYALTDSITGQFTLANLASIGTYLPIFLRSIWLSLFASFICLVIGYPVAYFIAQCKPTTQRFLEMLIMLPMCMSFLLRTLAWVAMLEDTGIFNTLLQSIGLTPLPLIRTNGAVILGMVYNYLPYMILPLYTVIMKIDGRLVEAAADLGCKPSRVFTKVILPLSGFTAARGTLSLPGAIIWATIGSVLGAWTLYGISRWVGLHRINLAADKIPGVSRKDVSKANDWFTKYGTWSVLIGRVIPVVRSLISIPAGFNRMNFLHFTGWTLLGSAVWNTILVSAGYLLGDQWCSIQGALGVFEDVVIAAVIVVIVWFVVQKVRTVIRNRKSADGNE